MSTQLTLLIPCFNEAEGIAQLCDRLRALLHSLDGVHGVEIVFVDDGCTDETAARIASEAKDLPYRMLTHDRNRGLGAALKTGFAHCRGDVVVVLDSDCTYDPDQVPRLLARIDEGADVVTASPYHPDGRVEGVASWRLLLSKSLSRLYWLVLPTRLHTYTACFRAYRRDTLNKLAFEDDGFLGVTQLLVSAILGGARVVEEPAVLTTRRFGQSKIRVAQVSWSHLRFLSRTMVRRLTGPRVPANSGISPNSEHEGS